VKLFIFPSSTTKNIWEGIRAGMWAVAETNPARMKELITKSQGIPAGSKGVSWSTEFDFFTTVYCLLVARSTDKGD
jgi:hypothetical protein